MIPEGRCLVCDCPNEDHRPLLRPTRLAETQTAATVVILPFGIIIVDTWQWVHVLLWMLATAVAIGIALHEL